MSLATINKLVCVRASMCMCGCAFMHYACVCMCAYVCSGACVCARSGVGYVFC